MKKKKEITDNQSVSVNSDVNDEIKTFIRKKNIQNKVLKEMIDQLKSNEKI